MTLHAWGLEWLFFLVSLAVLAFAIWTLRTATTDQSIFIGSKINGPRKATADANVQSGWFHLSNAAVMVGCATLTLFLEPPPPEFTKLPQSIVFLVGWILLGCLSALAAILAKSARRKLMAFAQVEHQVTAFVTQAPIEVDRPDDAGTNGLVVSGRRASDDGQERPMLVEVVNRPDSPVPTVSTDTTKPEK